MAGSPAEPPPSDRRSGIDGQADPRVRDGELQAPNEHSGPVTVARHAKDDGRALILYTSDEHART
jgi:hypothetical protein